MAYQIKKTTQLSLDPAQPSIQISADNKWAQLAGMLPWQELEAVYARTFPKRGRGGKPFQLLYGAQLIKEETGLSDVGVVKAIRDTPAYQYFLGLPKYEAQKPFDPSTLTLFRRRITTISGELRQIMGQWTKEKLRDHFDQEKQMIIDATVAPVNIRFPQDYSLLNQARLILETDIKELAHQLQVKIPRTYKREAHQKFVKFTKKPHRSSKETRAQVRTQLQYVRRDLRYMKELLDQGGQLSAAQQNQLETIKTLYAQQTYMYTHKTHRVEDRIVSLAQSYVRPIKRGKARQNTEFGPKIDVTLQDGVVEIERLSFDSFNESTDFQGAIEHYRQEHGYYPDEVLADKLYRNRANIKYAKGHGIKIIGPKLGRKPKNVDQAQRRAENALARDAENRRGTIERTFAFAKSKCGLGLLRSKTAETALVEVDTAIVLTNIATVLQVFSLSLTISVEKDGFKWLFYYQVRSASDERIKNGAQNQ